MYITNGYLYEIIKNRCVALRYTTVQVNYKLKIN